MSVDQSVVAAIEAAVHSDPSNESLRVHLATLQISIGQPANALEHCATVLTMRPDHLGALDCAARAADALADHERAEAYRRLHRALSGEPAEMHNPNQTVASESSPESELREYNDDDQVPAKGGNLVRMRLVKSGVDDDGLTETETPAITLADVAGMDEVKRRLNLAFLAPMHNPEVMKLYGKSMRGGLLLYGPPGCGKTFIARAVAGELGAKFVSVGLSDVLDMWLGNSERNLHEIFETARRSAPCVLFFDEVDALGRRRSLVRHSSVSTVIAQLLAEMDNVQSINKGVFILAATNHPWDVDTALRRPGRLDRTLLVLPPDRAARESILRFHLRDRPARDLNLGWIAERTDEFSGADLAHLVDSAAELAMEESLTTGTPRPINIADFKRAMKDLKPSTRPWFETARNYAMFSNEGGVYDDLLNYLRARRML